MDDKLKWGKHISQICKKLRKTCYNLRLLSRILDLKLARMVYFAIVQSIIQYGIIAWGGTYTTTISPLTNLLSKIIKICLRKQKFYSTTRAFAELKVMNIGQIFICTLLKFVYNNITIFPMHTTSHLTRRQANCPLAVPKYKKTVCQRHSSFLGPTMYNRLESDFKNALNNTNYIQILNKIIRLP